MPDAAKARWNHAAWLAPVLAVFGLLSYFLFFYQFPVTRDFPWLNLLVLAGAVALGILAAARARSAWGRVGASTGLVVSVGLLGLFCFYCFVMSADMPDPNRVVDDGTRIPAVTLASSDGSAVDLGQVASDKLVLVFYRGHW